MILRILILLLLALPLAAQQTLTLTGPATARPGQTISVNVAYSGSTASTLQWDLALPAGVSGTPIAGPRATAANKQLARNANRNLLWGMNTTAITAGDVATYPLTVAAGLPTGTLRLNLTGIVAATGAGSQVAGLVAGPELAIKIVTPDLNGDGVVNSADVTIAVGQAVTAGGPCTSDMTGDGVCDAVDAQIVINAALAAPIAELQVIQRQMARLMRGK